MAEIDARIKGIRETRVRFSAKTSTAKIIAAMGALNKEDIAPAAAQPIRSVLEAWFIRKILDNLELMAAPEKTVGDSNPNDPPNPTVKGAVRMDP